MLAAPTGSASVAPWSQPLAPTTPAATPFAGGNPMGAPALNNLNAMLPASSNIGNNPPPVPQAPAVPFPRTQQLLGRTSSVGTNNYVPPSTVSPLNPFPPSNLLYAPRPNPAQMIQNEMNQRRLTQLEGENVQRRNATLTLREMGRQLLQDQMEVQEQILGYQFMLEHCMETLDHQNFILTSQSEELALLRAKIRQFEIFMNAVKQFRENTQYGQNISPESYFLNGNQLCSRDLFALQNSMVHSSFFPRNTPRTTSTKFQPFNPRYRSPHKRADWLKSSEKLIVLFF